MLGTCKHVRNMSCQIWRRRFFTRGGLPRARQLLEGTRPADRRNFLIRLCWTLLHAAEGDHVAARQEMDNELLRYLETAIFFYILGAAEFYALIGETDTAVDWLYRTVRGGDERTDWFRRDPLLTNVRSDPRFQQILASIDYRRRPPQ